MLSAPRSWLENAASVNARSGCAHWFVTTNQPPGSSTRASIASERRTDASSEIQS